MNAICDHPAIKAISFVGGDKAGKHIYDANGQRIHVLTFSLSHRFEGLCVVQFLSMTTGLGHPEAAKSTLRLQVENPDDARWESGHPCGR